MAGYHERYLSKLVDMTPVTGKDIAVLGCSFGAECEGLIRAGARSVTGFDLDPRIGSAFEHPQVRYERRSIVETGEPDDVYDVIYSVAVFEHVHDVAGGMREAVRICRPGGLIFILSSPLWFAPYGNHMISCLEALPWCHLLFTPTELRSKISEEYPSIAADQSHLDELVNRIHDPTYFNRLPPSAYVEAAQGLQGISVIQNTVWRAAPLREELLNEYLPRCLARGFPEAHLFGGAHFFAASKLP